MEDENIRRRFYCEDGDILVMFGVREDNGQTHIQLLSKNPEFGTGGHLSFGTYNNFIEARKAFTNYLEGLKREISGE